MAAPSDAAPAIVWQVEEGQSHQVSLSGLNPEAINLLRNAKPAELARVFLVQVELEDPIQQLNAPAIGGAYAVMSGGLKFRPDFPFERGVRYRASLRPDALPGLAAYARSQTKLFHRERPALAASTAVREIYPTAGELPDNLLKFYLHFSAPMSGGRIYEHIHLRDEAGNDVELPFLEIDEELWNPGMTRLTLFLDPGRIKREVRPLEEIGPALRSGHRYTLVIDSGWLDAQGAPLKSRFEKTFSVLPPDRTPPEPARWKMDAPKAGSRTGLVVRFDEPMDHALALRMMSVHRTEGGRVEGQARLSHHERTWTFEPVEAWPAGRFHLAIRNTIEDLAGNNIGKPFEVDLFERVERDLSDETSQVPFVIQ